MSEEQAIRDALSVFGDNAEKLAELTLKDAENFVAEIEKNIEAGDARGAGLAAHSIKSIMRQIGAAEFGEYASQMEQAGDNDQDIEKCKELWPTFKESYDRAKAIIENL